MRLLRRTGEARTAQAGEPLERGEASPPERPAAEEPVGRGAAGRSVAAQEPAAREPVEAAEPRRVRRPAEGTAAAAGTGAVTGRPRRRTLLWRTRDAGAAAVGTAGAGVVMLARLVMTIAVLIALLIGLAIVLRDVDANAGNTIVKGIHEGANFFAGAFTGLISFNGHAKRAITVDWGIALLVYLLVGAILSSLIGRVGRGGLRFERRHRTPAAGY
jgi:hypothetical protein